MFNVILADDEQATLHLIDSLIHWDELGLLLLGTVQNGNDLCEKADTLFPHIVLIDMNMPGIHGAELIKYLTDLKYNPKIIVISGYDDFSYTKAAINSKITGYLLKPVDEEELNETLQKAINELHTEQSVKQKNIQASISTKNFHNLLKEQTFWEHLENNTFTQTSIVSFMPENQLHVEPFFQVCAFRFLNLKEITIQLFQDSSSLMLFTIKNILDEIFMQYGVCYYKNHPKDILLLLTRKISRPSLQEKLEYACEALYKTLSLQVFIGVGMPSCNCDQLWNHYTNALYAVDNMPLFTKVHISFYEDISRLKLHHANSCEELLNISFKKSTSLFFHTVTEIFQSPSKYNINTICAFLQLWDFIYNRCLTISDITKNNKLRSALVDCYHKTRSPFSLSSILPEWILLSSLLHDSFNDDTQLGKKIKRYIDTHYQQNISISELADKYHLSRQHLFRLFKNETGVSPSAYILDKKIEKAKVLLLNPEIKVREIASLLGFTDESHFCHSFKKATNLSPRQYRNSSSESSEDI